VQLIDAFEHASGAAPAESSAASRVQLAACAVSWMRAGDDEFVRELLSGAVLHSGWLSRMGPATAPQREAAGDTPVVASLLRPTFLHLLRLPKSAEAQARAREERRLAQVAALRVPCTHTVLPLAADWLAAPTYCFGTDAAGKVDAAAMGAQLEAAVALLLRLRDTAPLRLLPRSRLLCRCLHVFTLPGAPWRAPQLTAALRAALEAFTDEQPVSAPAAVEGRATRPRDAIGGESALDVESLLLCVVQVFCRCHGPHLTCSLGMLAALSRRRTLPSRSATLLSPRGCCCCCGQPSRSRFG